MKVLKYKIRVCTDVIHQWFSIINELYLPEVGLTINSGHIFIKDRTDEALSTPEAMEIEYPIDRLHELRRILERSEELTRELREELFNDQELLNDHPS